MWIDKLSLGVLRVMTPLGPRYIRPTFKQRIYLLWLFRHFPVLPFQVLSARQRRLVDLLCAAEQFVALPPDEAPLLGTLERRPPVESEPLPPRKPSSRAEEGVVPFTADVRQRS
ncbi:MAG: hypothetical protein JST79_00435 [Acidobacteria bacterium]|jgi:hypothetical protein|nr:hypothetical protein [Acidobacteriota bacterium]HVU66709.1 hypothetical protein [Ktedonobacteraceae bacterium]